MFPLQISVSADAEVVKAEKAEQVPPTDAASEAEEESTK